MIFNDRFSRFSMCLLLLAIYVLALAVYFVISFRWKIETSQMHMYNSQNWEQNYKAVSWLHHHHQWINDSSLLLLFLQKVRKKNNSNNGLSFWKMVNENEEEENNIVFFLLGENRWRRTKFLSVKIIKKLNGKRKRIPWLFLNIYQLCMVIF